MKSSVIFILALLLSVITTTAYFNSQPTEKNKELVKSDEPLFWQAPMDANYRREEPGLSPMGMPLMPVYAEPLGGQTECAGLVTIFPRLKIILVCTQQWLSLSP